MLRSLLPTRAHPPAQRERPFRMPLQSNSEKKCATVFRPEFRDPKKIGNALTYALLRTHDVHLKLVARCVAPENLDKTAFLGLVDAATSAVFRHIPDMLGLGFVKLSDVRVSHPAPPNCDG
ncbi:hypothetical protein EMEDMD4_300096 [Sinorhizobium medicae]|uniref:Uncharacterized protein n=1 Tax=Sinorhizobium medicae TaxID=110321 RepID=A0A508WY49_9HYPH|nr:hypothetical protein EMEDMD4_300096 [Sinorhizobium medicae]